MANAETNIYSRLKVCSMAYPIINLVFFAGMLIYVLYASIGRHRLRDVAIWGLISLIPAGLICLLIWAASVTPILYFWVVVAIFIIFGMYAIIMLPVIDETDVMFYSLLLLYAAFTLPWPFNLISCIAIAIPVFMAARYALSRSYLSFRQKVFMYCMGMLSLGLVAFYQMSGYIMHGSGWWIALASGTVMGYAAMHIIPVAGILLRERNDRISYFTTLMANFSDRQIDRPSAIAMAAFASILIIFALLETDPLQVISWSFIFFMAQSSIRRHLTGDS
jgi:hypothetical protein